MPGNIDTNAYYIVHKSNVDFLDKIEKYQLDNIEFDNFYVYKHN